MALSSIKDFWIHPNALTITLNYFGDQQLIQTSMLAGAVIMAYKKDYIGYNAAHDFREWKLQAYPTQLSDTCEYFVHAVLSRDGDSAMVVYSPTKRGIKGETYDGNGELIDSTQSTDSWYIYLGTISASVDADGATVDRVWTDGLHTGTLATDQYRMEEAQGDWALMFKLVNDSIQVLKTITSATINALTVATNFIFGGKTFTGTAGAEDAGKENKRNDATLPTTGYVQKEIEALDDHFLIKDGTEAQQVSGDVSFLGNQTVNGDQSVGGSQTIQGEQVVKGNQTIGGKQTIGGEQDVKGLQTLHQGFKTTDYFEQGDLIQGAQVTKEGIASFAKVKTPSMQVYELTLNRKTAVQGEYVFSDGETIEEVTQLDDGSYQLRVREPYEGYVTTFKKDDVLYSNINIIGDGAKTGKCWMFVTEVDGATITATHYPSNMCPSGENIAPMPHMTITRHGNRSDKTRQDLFIISSETSSLTMLRGVDAPIVSSEGLYGVVIGKLPDTLLEYIHKAGFGYVNGEDPYVYARGVIVQDLIMLDYQGKPIVQERYRGEWRQEIANGLVEGEDRYQATASIADTVTYEGSLWRCMVSGTTVLPKDNIAEWQKKVSKGDDSTAVLYTLKPSTNVVYYRTASNTLSVDELTVKVSVVGNGEYYDIADQNTIEQAGLSVYYALDGEGEPILLNISPEGDILLEDGSGFIESEDGSNLLLEGEVLDITKIKDNITLYLKDLETGEMRASYVIPVIKDGEEGKQGRMLYPAGVYDGTREYKIENNSAPFVKEGDTYYVLVWEGSAVKGMKPSDDKQGVYWKPFTYMNYLFAEFLMANWAQLGGKNGAVFYEKWLFSQTLQDGMEYTKDIINSSGQFKQGKYPKCAIDFLNGTSYMSNIIEPMNEFDGTVLRIDPTKGFNWFIPCNTETNLYDGSLFSRSVPCCKPLIILPTLAALKEAEYSDWDINGAHITITYGSGDAAYAGLIGIVAGGSNSSLATRNTYVANEFILVCVDEIALEVDAVSGATNLFKTNPKSRMLSYSGSNFFINNGKRARYLMMAPGNTLKLRPVVIGKKTIHWFIESDGVSSSSLTMYSTAYVIPDRKDTGNGDYRIRIHNKMDEVGYVRGYHDNVPTISVYASKESLGNSSIKDNLKDVQEGNDGSCVFVCGEPALLPNKIVISAQKKYNVEETNESRYCYRALFTEGADKKCDIVDFSQG